MTDKSWLEGNGELWKITMDHNWNDRKMESKTCTYYSETRNCSLKLVPFNDNKFTMGVSICRLGRRQLLLLSCNAEQLEL